MDHKLQTGISFSSLTTVRLGGPMRYFAPAFCLEDLLQLLEIAQQKHLACLVMGGGSNLLVADEGFDGLVIQNMIGGIADQAGELAVGAGVDLQHLVWWASQHGLAGFQKLVGIPGSVGGAVYGNAGAYGQTISDHLAWVKVVNSHGSVTKLLGNQCEFSYRDSKFKKTKEIIIAVGFTGKKGAPRQLMEQSQQIMAIRRQKYQPGLACPGSFFKNVQISTLPTGVLAKIPPGKIAFGKISAGWLLEEVGAKGKRLGGVEIASWHGNLFINRGHGRASDFVTLASQQQKAVREKFGIALTPEVQLIGFGNEVFI